MSDLPRGIAAIDQRPLRLPRIGIIRPGEKIPSKSGKTEHPRELDYYNLINASVVLIYYARKRAEDLKLGLPERKEKELATLEKLLSKVPMDDEPDDKLAKALSEALQCRELDILFPTMDRGTICDTCYKAYGAGGFWKCRGNGIVAFNRDAQDEIECLGEDCQMVIDKGCRRQMTLTFICFLTKGVGVYQFTTGGWRAIENMLAQLDMFEVLFQGIGGFAGVPMKLYREPYDSSHIDADGKRKGRVHYSVRLDVDASLLEVRKLQIGGAVDIPPQLEECDPSQYPASYREGIDQAALPAAEEPAKAVIIPAEPEPDDIDPRLLEGFELLGIAEAERQRLLEKYKADHEKLFQYLSARLDVETDQTPSASAAPSVHWQEPEPAEVNDKPKPAAPAADETKPTRKRLF